MNLVDVVNEKYTNENVEKFPSFRSGDTVAVHAKIKEGNKVRIQVFQGVVIGCKGGKGINGHFRVRKISSGIGVERVFPFHSPNIDKIEVVQRGKSRKSKLYYLRDRSGRSARIAIDYDRK
jgi:large subunit ribosomal protein L19